MEFNLNRFLNLIKRDFVLHKKQMLLWSISLFILCGFIMFLTGTESHNGKIPDDAGDIVFGIMLIFGGLSFTLMIFSEYKLHASRIQYLSMPISNFERLLSKWFYSLPLYTLLTWIVFCIGYLFFSILLKEPLNAEFVSLSDLRYDLLFGVIWVYFILHAGALFLGSLFNRFAIPKAIVLSGALGLIATLITVVLFRIIMSKQYVGLFKAASDSHTYHVSEAWQNWVNLFAEDYMPWIISLLIVPFFWVVTYFKIKEKQA